MDEERIRAAFGRNVRRIRTERGISQEALGDLAGLDRTYVSGVERGIRNPTLLSQCRLAAALEVEPAELVEGLKLTI